MDILNANGNVSMVEWIDMTRGNGLAEPALAKLRLQAGLFSAAAAMFVFGGYLLIRSAWEPAPALRWLALTLGCSLYLLWILWRGLPENRRAAGQALLGSLGAANVLSLGRGLLLAAVAGFLFSPRPEGWLAWLPGALYILAGLADVLDGYLARVTNHTTRLGESLDLNLDAMGVLAAAGLAVQWGQAPAFYLSVALARYAYSGALALWERSGRPVRPLQPSVRRRAFAGLQMGLLMVILWPVFGPPGTRLAAALFSLPFLAGFAYDWLYAAGLVGPAGKAGWLRAALPKVRRILPPALRLAAAGLGAWQILALTRGGAPILPEQAALALLEAALLLLILLGAAGRVASIACLLALGGQQIYASLTPAQVALAAVLVALLYLGTGVPSLWTPEDRLIYRRFGE